MESSSSSRGRRSQISRAKEKFVSTVLWPAIRRGNCPICLSHLSERRTAVITVCNHAYCIECIRKWSNLKRSCPLCNAQFNSWIFDVNLASGSFREWRLRPLGDEKRDISEAVTIAGDRGRVTRRWRGELSSVRSQTRALPWRRSFGRPGVVSSGDIAERKLQWRASIYNQRLLAVPLAQMRCVQQNISDNDGMKESVLQRIEPWIRRELMAILGDPDPSVIVHVATSVFVASIGRKFSDTSGQLDVEDNFLAPLQPFLHIQTNLFWHELRCFAESSLSMETYDAVVQYKCLD